MNEDTFSKFTEIESGLQSLIDDGNTKKEEIMKLLESGLNNFDWFGLGYDMANGDKGSGWMAISDIEEYRKMSQEEVVEDVHEWVETDNFNHEVGELLRKHYHDMDDDGEAMMIAQDDWIEGYVSAINHELEKPVLEEVE